MPIYNVQAPDGRSFDLEGDSPPTEQELESVFASLPKSGLKSSTQENLAAAEAARQAIIQSAQRSPGQKLIEGTVAGVGGLADIIAKTLSGIPATVSLASTPSKILPTLGESAERTIIDFAQLGNMLRPKSAGEALMGPAGAIVRGLSNLRSRTPTEEEISSQLEEASMAEALGEERAAPRFEGADLAAAETLNQITQAISPVKGAQALRAIPKGMAGIGKAVRTATKPSKAVIGNKLEKVAVEEMPEIFSRNPNVQNYEGFANEVKASFEEAGNRISDLKSLSGSTLNAGDELADKILAKAVDLESAGQPRAVIEEMTNRAEDIRGRLTNINSLSEAVTISNRKPNILKPKTTAEGFVDEIISKEGGSLINKELETIGGPEGLVARKKWSNLKLLNDSVQDRLNKIVNSAPAEARPLLLETLASPEGVAGMFALMNGWTGAGVAAIGIKGLQKWAKGEVKALKNSDTIMARKYEELRRSPP